MTKREFIINKQHMLIHAELEPSIFQALELGNTVWIDWEGGDVPEGKVLVISLKLRDKEEK